MIHVPANPIKEGDIVNIDKSDIEFCTEAGLKGGMTISRWINPAGDEHPGLRYFALIVLEKPESTTRSGNIGLPTNSLEEILHWIKMQVEKINNQFKLGDTALIVSALQSIHAQFQEHLGTLQAEDLQIRDLLAQL